MKKIILSLVCATALAGCTYITENHRMAHGYAPTPLDINYIKQQPTITKTSLIQAIGKPFATLAYNDNNWYYIAYKTTQYGFGKRKYTNLRIVEIIFDGEAVKDIKEYDDKTIHQIAYNKKATQIEYKDLSIIDQFIGNIGKFQVPTQ